MTPLPGSPELHPVGTMNFSQRSFLGKEYQRFGQGAACAGQNQ